MKFLTDPTYNLAPTTLWRAEPDGYTIGGAYTHSFVTNQQRLGNTEWDIREFTIFGGVNRSLTCLAVPADSPYQTIDDFKNAGRVRWSTSLGSSSHLASVLISELFGIESNYIGYEGFVENVLAIMRGDADATMTSVATVLPYIESGELKVLATLGDEEDPRLSGVPAAVESGLESVAPVGGQILAFIGPPGVPRDVIDLLAEGMKKCVEDEDLIAWSKRAKRPMVWTSPERATELIADTFKIFEEYTEFIK
jgi:tripartite-type tricarboxylate transporter receptor subunit TctC